MARVEDWPGISLVKNVLSGKPARGTWFDRTAEHRAKLRGEDFEPRRYATEETVELSQLPCWRYLSPEMYREAVAELIEEIESDARAERKRTRREPLGQAAILRQHPHTCPNKSKKSPAPRFHAATKAVREVLRQAYRPLPCGFPRSGREAQGWRPDGQVPQRLLSSGPAFRPCVSD
ncbi:MAG: REP-associated tyrosine transposase [Acidobacteriota bacterium]|nr:REP-associated tyrosine transposase [Acidobacteriota bacterium]